MDHTDYETMMLLYSLPSKVTNISTRFITNAEDEKYFDFQFTELPDILKQKENQEQTVTCKICNIHIPSKYYSTHVKNFKHVTQLKIISSLTKRHELYQSEETKLLNTSIKNDAESYCSICDMIYSSSCLDHLSSDEHKESVAQDGILHDYYTHFVKSTDENEINISLQNIFHEPSSEFNNLELCTKRHIAEQQYFTELEKNTNVFSDYTDVLNIYNMNVSDKNGLTSSENVNLKKNINLDDFEETQTKVKDNSNTVKSDLDKSLSKVSDASNYEQNIDKYNFEEHKMMTTKKSNQTSLIETEALIHDNLEKKLDDKMITTIPRQDIPIITTKSVTKNVITDCTVQPQNTDSTLNIQYKLSETETEGNWYICPLCNVAIINVKSSIDEHKESKKHVKMMNQLQLDKISPINTFNNLSNIINNDKSFNKTHELQNNEKNINTPNVSNKHEKITNEMKLNSPEQYVEPKSNLSKFSNDLDSNKQKQICASNNTCKSKTQNYDRTQNVNEDVDLEFVTNLLSVCYKKCPYCNIDVIDNAIDMALHKNSRSHRENMFNNWIINNFCLNSDKGKFLGYFPRRNWHGLVRFEKINLWECLLCKCNFNNAIEHIKSENHLIFTVPVNDLGYRRLLFGYHCVICNMITTDIEKHLYDYHYVYRIEVDRKKAIEKQRRYTKYFILSVALNLFLYLSR